MTTRVKKAKRFYVVGYHGAPDEVVETDTKPNITGLGGPHSSVSCAMTEEELREKTLPEPCKECGGVVYLHFNEKCNKKLRDQGVCHACDHWRRAIKNHADPGRVTAIVNAQFYTLVKTKGSGEPAWRGHGGRVFWFEFHDGRKVACGNVWHGGQVPEHFRDRLPDNAEVVAKPTSVEGWEEA